MRGARLLPRRFVCFLCALALAAYAYGLPPSAASEELLARKLLSSSQNAPQSAADIAGSKPEAWCAERQTADQGATELQTLTLAPHTFAAKSDIYTCSTQAFPATTTVPEDAADLVEIRVAPDSGLFLSTVLVMSCDAGMHWLDDAVEEPQACMRATTSLLTACQTLWVGVGGARRGCAKPGLIMANLGDVKRRGKVLVVQAQWAFDSRAIGRAITISNTTISLGLRQRDTQAEPPQEVGTWHGSPIYANNSLTKRYGSLVIPAQEPAYTINHGCSRRCSLVALRGNPARPQKHVTVIGYRLSMRQYGTNISVRIKRCPNNYNGEDDVEWKIDAFNWTAQPVYEVANGGVKLYGGDSVEWSCTYNTVNANTTVVGGYRLSQDELCNVQLLYWPAVEDFNGCAADQYSHSVCFYEAKSLMQEEQKYDSSFPMRPLLDPFTTGPYPWSKTWKATWLLVMVVGITGLLWGTHVLLMWLSKPSAKQALDTDPCFAKNAQETESAADEYLPPPPTITHDIDTDSPPPKRPLSTRIKASLASIARDFNALGQSYAALSPGNRRNVCTYVVHLIVDTAGFFWTLWLLLQVWCLCGDVVMNAQHYHLVLSMLIALYLCELLWKPGMDLLLLLHHLATIAIITIFGMELLWMTWASADVLVVLALFGYLEQPTFFGLLVYRLAPQWKGLPRLWAFQCWFWVLSKLASLGMAIWLMVWRWPYMDTWLRVVYPILWFLMVSIEMLSANILFQILKKIKNKQNSDKLRAARQSSPGLSAIDENEDLQSNSDVGGDAKKVEKAGSLPVPIALVKAPTMTVPRSPTLQRAQSLVRQMAQLNHSARF